MEESVDAYYRFLAQKLTEFRARLNELISALSGNDKDQKERAARLAHKPLTDLKAGLATADQPAWLTGIDQKLNWYFSHLAHEQSNYILMQALMHFYNEVKSFEWKPPKAAETPALDFDRLFKEYYESSRLPDLFEQLIAKLAEIAGSGHVDSIRVLKMLERAIATMRANLRKTYYSTYGAWHIVQKLMRNTSWEMLGDIPALGGLVRGVKATVDEIEKEMETLEEHSRESLSKGVEEVLQLPAPPKLLTAGNGEDVDKD